MAQNIYKKFTQDIVIVVITGAVLSLKGLFILPVISKTLGASGYGIWVQALVTISLVATFCDLNLSAALARFLAAEKDKEEIREGFFTVTIFSLCLGVLIAVILVLLRNPIADALFHDPNATSIVIIAAVIIPLFELNAVAVGFFRAFREIKTYSWFIIGRELGGLIILVPLVLTGFGVYGALVSVLATYAVTNAIMFYLIISRVGATLPRFYNLKPYLKFSLPTIPNALSNWIVASSDRYVIGFFLGIAPVGIYSASYGLGNAISSFSAPLSFLLIPTLSWLYDEGKINEVKMHLTYSLKYFLMMAIPAVFGLSMLARSMLDILTTAEFLPVASTVVPLVAVSLLLFGIYIVYSQVHVLTKKMGIIGVQGLVAAALNLGLNIVFVPIIGVVGAAVTTLLAYSVTTAWIIITSRKYLRFTVDWGFILKSIAASVVMSLLIWKLDPTGIPGVVSVIVLGVIVYFAVLFLLKGFKKEEVNFFKSFLKRST